MSAAAPWASLLQSPLFWPVVSGAGLARVSNQYSMPKKEEILQSNKIIEKKLLNLAA